MTKETRLSRMIQIGKNADGADALKVILEKTITKNIYWVFDLPDAHPKDFVGKIEEYKFTKKLIEYSVHDEGYRVEIEAMAEFLENN